MSAFPLPQITAAGITSPSFNDILNYLTSQFQSIYGTDVILTPDSQDGQWLGVQALAYYDLIQQMVATFQAQSPTFAQGAGLSSVVKINGLQRLVPSNSTAVVTIVGVVGTTIANGVVQDANGNLWNLPASVSIPGGGTISVTATAQAQGAIAAIANSITIIFTPTLGWQSVTNPAAAVLGAPVESDAALRTRQSISTGLPAQTPLQAIAATVANIPGVIRSIVYENNTSITDGNGVPSHSIAVVVQGGNVTQVGTAIESKKSPGTGTFGTTSVTISDPAGLPITINFFALVTIPIFINLTLHPLLGFQTATEALIISALVAFINALPIGGPVYYNQLIGIASMIEGNPLGSTYNITGMQIGIAPNPNQTADIAIPFNEAAVIVIANINITLA